MAYDTDLNRLVDSSRDALRVLEQLAEQDLDELEDELVLAVTCAKANLEEALEAYGG